MKKIRNFILTFLLMFVGVVGVSALTEEEMEHIEQNYREFRSSSKYFEGDKEQFYYFEEGVKPNINFVGKYATWGVFDYQQYILNPEEDYGATGENIKYQVPKDIFESNLEKTFVLDDKFYTELRNNFKPSMSITNAEYKEINESYYYYYELHYGMGWAPNAQPHIKGYKDLGNNQYQVYFYDAIVKEDAEYIEDVDLMNEDNVYITRKNYADKDIEYLVLGYLTSKIEYKNNNIKYLSYEELEENDIPDDLILYERIEEDKEETPSDSDDVDKEDSSKSNWDLLYEYFNDRVFDDMFDSFEDITILKDDNTIDITYIVDGKTYEMQYTYNNGILIYSKIGSRQYDEYYNGLVYEFLVDRFKYNVEKLSIYLERSEGLTVEKDGIEYTFTEMYTEKEMEQKEKEFEEYWNSLTEEEKQEQGGAIGIGNPLVFSSLKVDLTNGVKTYKEELVPYYDVVEGEEQKFNSDKPEELTFKIDVDFDLFEGVYMNGKLLDPKYYTAKEGSTIITLKKDYLTELNNGTHTIKVAFKDGEFAETTFTVEKTVKNPTTGIVFKCGLFVLIGLISCLSYLLIRKQSRFPKHN